MAVAARQAARVATRRAKREPKDGHPTHEHLEWNGPVGEAPKKLWGEK